MTSALAAVDAKTIRKLWKDFAKTHSDDIRNTLIEHYLPIVRYTAERLYARLPDEVSTELEGFRFKAGIERIMAAARESNRYFDRKQPWAQRKTDMAACATTINVVLRTIRALGVVMEPYLPFAAVVKLTLHIHIFLC